MYSPTLGRRPRLQTLLRGPATRHHPSAVPTPMTPQTLAPPSTLQIISGLPQLVLTHATSYTTSDADYILPQGWRRSHAPASTPACTKVHFRAHHRTRTRTRTISCRPTRRRHPRRMTPRQAFARRNHFPAPRFLSRETHSACPRPGRPGSGAASHAYATDTTRPRPNQLRPQPGNTTFFAAGRHHTNRRLLNT
jgi:hypothetical protein